MSTLEIRSHKERKARTRSLIQLGSLIDKAELTETFGIVLGKDVQKDPEMKGPIAALFKRLLVLKEIAQSEDVYSLWTHQGLETLAKFEKNKN